MKNSFIKKLLFLIPAGLLICSLLPATVLAAIPTAPSGLYAIAGSGQVDLYWTDNSADETGFNVERAPDIGGLGPGDYVHLGPTPSVASNVTAFSDTTVSPTSAYWYRVAAVNASGSSFFSNQTRILTLISAPQVPALTAPAGGFFNSGAANTISANATVSGTNITSVEYQLVTNNAAGIFDARDIWSTQLDLTVLAPRAAGPTNDATVMPSGLPAGCVAEFDIRGTVSAVNLGTGMWSVGTQPIVVYESVTAQPQSTKFVGSRHPVVGDAVRIIAYRTVAGGPLVAKTITYIAPAQPAGTAVVTLNFLLNATVDAMTPPVTAPGYLIAGELWTIGSGDFRIDAPYFPAYIDANVGMGTAVTVRFGSPPTEANVARQIFNQVIPAIATTIDINPTFDTSPVPLNVPSGTWTYVIVDGVVSGYDNILGVWTIGEEGIKCYQTAQSVISPATVGDEVLLFCVRTMTPGPLVIESTFNILAGPLIRPYKPTAVDVRLMYNGVIQTMGPNTWTVAGPAGAPVTFIVDDAEGKARIDPIPYAAFAVGMPVTVEFEHVGEALFDDANWAPLIQGTGNAWSTSVSLPAVPVNQTGRLFLRATDATMHAGIFAFASTLNLMPTAGPAAPSVLAYTIAAGPAVNLTWTDNSNNEASFRIERAPDVAGSPGTFASIGTVGANVVAYSDATIAINNIYHYRVVAVNLLGSSAPSNVVMVNTGVPPAPTNLNVALTNATSVVLTWSDTPTETGYRVERASNAAPTVFTQRGALLGANVVTAPDTILATEIWHYRIVAFNAVGDSVASAVVPITYTSPVVPSNVTVTVTGSITVSWTDNSSNERGFNVLRAQENPASPGNPLGAYGAVALAGNPTAPNVTSFLDTTAVSGTSYLYQVVALGTTDGVVVPNAAPVVSPVITNAIPANPTGLTAAAAAYNSVNLAWTDNATNETGYRIEKATGAGAFSVLITIAAGSSSYIDNTVAASTSYQYQVFAVNGMGASALPAGPMAVNTPAQPVPTGGGGGGFFVANTPVTVSGMSGTPALTVDTQGIVVSTTVLSDTTATFSMSLPAGTRLQTSTGVSLNTLTHTVPTAPPAVPAQKAFVGSVHDFGPDGAVITPGFTLTLKYTTSALPAGATEGTLQIAWWNGTAWTTLTSQVDTTAHEVRATVTHFTNFVLLATIPTVTAPTTPTIVPANFSVSNLMVTPANVGVGDAVTINVNVANTGGTSGVYVVALKVNGVQETQKSVTLAAGAQVTVSFETKKSSAATYDVEINGLQSTFTVVAPVTPTQAPTTPAVQQPTAPATTTPTTAAPVPTPAAGPSTNWFAIIFAIIGGIIVVGVLIYFVSKIRLSQG